MASIDWEAAISALDAGELPCSNGERRVLRLAASIAAGAPVSLGNTLTGIDDRNATLAIQDRRNPGCWHLRPELGQLNLVRSGSGLDGFDDLRDMVR